METLKTRAEFQRVRKGRKWVAPAFILQGLARASGEANGPRFGFTVSGKSVAKDSAEGKRRGKAVDRNRARRRLKEAKNSGMPLWQDKLFIALFRQSANPTDFFSIPSDRVVELGEQVAV